jgi:hypothetical protein
MWLDDDSVIHIMEPVNGLIGHLVECHLLKALMEKLVITGDSGKLIATPSVCSQNWPLKLKYEEVRTWQKILSISPLKCQPRLASKFPSVSI